MDYCSHFRPKAFSFAIFDCWGFRGHQFHGRTNHLFKSRRVENDGRMMRAKGGIWMNMMVNIPLHCNHKSQGFKLVKPCAGSHLDPHVEHSTATSYRDLTLFGTPLGSWLLHYEKMAMTGCVTNVHWANIISFYLCLVRMYTHASYVVCTCNTVCVARYNMYNIYIYIHNTK